MNNLKKFSSALLIPALTFFLMFSFTGCKEDEFGGSAEIEMTDGPGDYGAVNLEITKIEANHESEGWTEISSESQVITITDFTNGKSAKIATKNDLRIGTYNNIRLTIGANSSIEGSIGSSSAAFNSIVNATVEIPVNVEVNANSTTNILLDFMVGKSVASAVTGFTLDPAVRWVEDRETGVQGSVEANAKAYVMLSNSSKTYDTYTDANGAFYLQGCKSGTYDLEIEPRSDQGFPTTVTVENVVVADGEITQMGSITLN